MVDETRAQERGRLRPVGWTRVRMAIDIAAVLALVAGLIGVVVVLGQRTDDRASASAIAAIDRSRKADPVGFRYLLQLQSMMQRASDGRADAVKAITAVEDGCRMNPNKAAGIVHSLAMERQDLLDSLGLLPLPPNHPKLAEMVVRLESADSLALATDQAYTAWFLRVAHDSYRPGKGCPGGPPRTGPYWNRVVEAEAEVAPARARFVAEWNPYAGRFGLFDWSADRF